MRWLIVAFVVGCTPVNAPLTDTADCKSACTHLGPTDLNCEEGKPLEDGTPCQKFCEETQASGHALHPSCVMLIKTCDEIGTCQRRHLK